jgi:opacity protein-like surface antigen
MRSPVRGVFSIALASVAILIPLGSNVRAQEFEEIAGRGLYVGVFGGGGGSGNVNTTQEGYALYRTGGPPDGLGPLRVFAPGTLSSQGTGLVGLQIGKEWSGWKLGSGSNSWGLLPALEFEASYQHDKLEGHLVNPTPRLPEHEFEDTFPMNTGVFVANAVFSLQTPLPRIHPYIGIGLGTAYTSISGADSTQILFPEPGVNHFNSGPDSSRWSFVVQAKTGLRFDITERVWIFTEYRFQDFQATDYTFGSTVYPDHIATTAWNVHVGSICRHLAVGGIGFSF